MISSKASQHIPDPQMAWTATWASEMGSRDLLDDLLDNSSDNSLDKEPPTISTYDLIGTKVNSMHITHYLMIICIKRNIVGC